MFTGRYTYSVIRRAAALRPTAAWTAGGLRSRIIQGLALLVLGAGAAAAEDAVLLGSTAPGYAPGMVLAERETLTLPDGASATLLFRSGQMLRLRGPFAGSVQTLRVAAKGESLTMLAEALRMQGVDASVIGGTRASVARHAGPRDVVVDAQRSATYCLGPTDTLWLSHLSNDTGRLGLRRRANLRELAWPAGAAKIEWPGDVTVEDGDRFDIVTPGGGVGAIVTFRRVSDEHDSEAARVAQAILLGCREQVDASLREVARHSLAPELWLTSDRGRDPVYRRGEPIRLTVQSSADGFVYCVVRREDGESVPVFPAGAIDGARVRGHMPLAIPGQRGAREMRVGARPGQEEISCYFADRDITAELPSSLVDGTLSPLPESVAANLESTFEAVRAARIAKAGLTIRVD